MKVGKCFFAEHFPVCFCFSLGKIERITLVGDVLDRNLALVDWYRKVLKVACF